MAAKSNAKPAPKSAKSYMQALAHCNEACASMDISDGGWKPPVGTYDVTLTDVTINEKTNDGVQYIGIKPAFEIIGGELEGRTFTDFFWIAPSNPAGSEMPLKGLLRLATCIAGSEVRQADQAVQVIEAAKGESLAMEVFETSPKKGKNVGKTFKNYRYLELLATTVEEEVDAETVEA